MKVASEWRTGIALAVLVGLAALAGLTARMRPGSPLQPAVTPQPAQSVNASELAFTAADRILVLAPHPDDETIGTAGVIQKATSLGLPVRVVFLTNGDANEWSFVLYSRRLELLPSEVRAMGAVRHDEALAAARRLGLQPEQLTFLGYPDFGTLRIWTSHWDAEPPLRSIFAHATHVPYSTAYRPGAAYKGEEILADLKAVLDDFIAAYGPPTKVFLSHPADHNSDHMALYAFTRVALWDLGLRPRLYSYLVHAPRWPEPRGLAPSAVLAPPAGLTGQEAWWTMPLSQAEVSRKLTALESHRTQYDSNERYLSSFIRANELFGDYPDATVAGTDAGLSLGTGAPSQSGSEELTDAEQAKFVGAEWHSVRREGNDLVLAVALSKPLAKGVTLSVYLFGYRSDVPFAAMPKIHVEVGELSEGIYDQSRRLAEPAVQVHRDARDIVLRAPTALLNEPDRVLVHLQTYLGDLPLDSAAWRVLSMRTN